MPRPIIITQELGLYKGQNYFINQRTGDGYINATNLVNIHNANTGENKELERYFITDKTIELIEKIAEIEKIDVSTIKVAVKGKYGGTWTHPMVALDLAGWLDAGIKILMYNIVIQEVFKSRDDSKEASKVMNEALYLYFMHSYNRPPADVDYIREANMIKFLCDLNYDETWDNASKKKLELRTVLCQANTMSLIELKPIKAREEVLLVAKKMFLIKESTFKYDKGLSRKENVMKFFYSVTPKQIE